MSVTLNGTSGLVFGDGTIQGTAAGNSFRNRIINGDMRIDQRNAGASVPNIAGNVYTLDRWQSVCTVAAKMSIQQRSDTPPAGFTHYARMSTTSAYTTLAGDWFLMAQRIEGYNIADLGYGTSSARDATISFWARASITGQYSVSIRDNSGNPNFRTYAATYTITQANTWEYKTVLIPAPTASVGGSWGKINDIGFQMYFSFGVGSAATATGNTWSLASSNGVLAATGNVNAVAVNGATLDITGVQFEKAAAATSFEQRPFAQELAMCQRYYEKSFAVGTKPIQNVGTTSGCLLASNYSANAAAIVASTSFMVTKRAVPSSITTYNPFAAGSGWSRSGSLDFAAGDYATGEGSIGLRVDGATGTSTGNMSIHWAVDAELG